MRNTSKFITCLFILLVLLCAFQSAWASEGNINTTDKYAWSENAGWLNFRPADGGVTVFAGHLSGYVWAENIGYIKLGGSEGGGSPNYYLNTSSTN